MGHAYITAFDSNYLIKGVSMLRSLLAHDPSGTVTVVCLDQQSFRLLVQLNISGVCPIPLSAVEATDKALSAVKTKISSMDYFWTLPPSLLLRFLEQMDADQILTYIDPTLLFFSSPEPLFEEMGESSLLLSKQNFSSCATDHDLNGVYNVAWMSCRNNADSRKVLSWWRQHCLMWCHNPNQKEDVDYTNYLESFSNLTNNIVISQNPAMDVGPWNFTLKPETKIDVHTHTHTHTIYIDTIEIIDGIPSIQGRQTIFFHYHSAAYLFLGVIAPISDLLYQCTLDMLHFYIIPYLNALDNTFEQICSFSPSFRSGLTAIHDIANTVCIMFHKKYIKNINQKENLIDIKEDYSVSIRSQLHFHQKKTVSFQKHSDILRILEIETWYPLYLENFYKRHPNLDQKRYKEQIATLLDDGFSACHMFVPYLENFGCKVELIVANSQELQRTWFHEHHLPTSEMALEERLLKQIQIFQPDVLYTGDPIRFDSHFIRKLNPRPKLVGGWRAADTPTSTDWQEYDFILSGLPRLLQVARSLGARDALLFYPGMPKCFIKEPSRQETDVCFVGSMTPSQHRYRQKLLNSVAQAAEQYHFSLALHLSCIPEMITRSMQPYLKQPLYGVNMYRAYSQSKIVLDTQGDIRLINEYGKKIVNCAAGDTSNMRIFEGAACGAMILTQDMHGLSRIFTPNVEVAVYHDEQEMLDQIRYFLNHPQEREAIAKRGQERCLAEWNLEHQAQCFLDILKEKVENCH